MLGMGLRATELSSTVAAKRTATTEKAKVVRTSTKRAVRTSSELPRPPAGKRK